MVLFYSREFGRLSGVAKGARRPRSRFGSALELFTQGQLLFFETGRSPLVRVDQFDLLHPFLRLQEEIDRLGQAAWVVECLGRLTAERDPHAALYGLLIRTLRALEEVPRPERAALAFILRAVDLLGHRLRLERCLGCRGAIGAAPRLDFSAGGLVCGACASRSGEALPVSPHAVRALRRMRVLRWEELLAARLPRPVEAEIAALLGAQVVQLMGRPLRTDRFLTQTRRTLATLGSIP